MRDLRYGMDIHRDSKKGHTRKTPFTRYLLLQSLHADRKKPLLGKGFKSMGPTGLEPVTNRL